MSNPLATGNRVQQLRLARGWSQVELASQAGVSRTGISAIEGRRLAPSVATALALARALSCSVEELFGADEKPAATDVRWAWDPAAFPCRYWAAEVGGQRWLIPAEYHVQATHRHDGVLTRPATMPQACEQAERTLVIACCDPAAGLLAQEYERQTGFRMLILNRSSGQAMELLEQGLVHVAGVHWAESTDRHGNAGVLQQRGLKTDVELLNVVDWEEGLAVRNDAQIRSVRQAAKSPLRWIGRLPGAGARRRQDQILGEQRRPAKIAQDHRDVANAIRGGWADIGVCVRIASEEGRLGFISVSQESYELCYCTRFANDPRLIALRAVVRSPSYRGTLSELPGYDPARCGEVQRLTATVQ